jgi:hypothetical protein
LVGQVADGLRGGFALQEVAPGGLMPSCHAASVQICIACFAPRPARDLPPPL